MNFWQNFIVLPETNLQNSFLVISFNTLVKV